jgi:hypothetical protein
VNDATGVEGREISRKVLAEMSAAFEDRWRAALEYQRRNPDVLAAARTAPTEFADAADVMVRSFAEMHPTVLRAAIAHCQAVVDEFGFEPDIRVAPTLYRPTREGEPMFAGDGDRDVDERVGGQQQHDRLVWNGTIEQQLDELRDWNAQLEDELGRVRAILSRMGAAAIEAQPAVLPTNTE